jgi:hypothetical protein
MEAPYINPINVTLQPGEELPIEQPANGIICRSLDGAPNIMIKLRMNDGSTDFLPFAVGDKFNMPHKDLVLKNPLLVAAVVELFQVSSPGVYQDLRQRGELDILGNVTTTGQPTSTYGGTIIPLGKSWHRVTYPTVGATTYVTVVAAADNPNGLIVRTALFSESLAASASNLYSTDGVFFSQNGVGVETLMGERYIEPGQELNIGIGANNLTAVEISYDILG